LYQGQTMQDQAGADAVIKGQESAQTNSQIQRLLDPSGTMSKLDQWMNPLASGQGGYNASELSQIQMTPAQQQDIVNSAGVSAGLSNAASTGAAARAAAAAGGNPLALATYRARAAQSAGANAADAMTKARIGASDAAAGRAQTIGNTRIGQQNTGLGYYSGLQNQGSNYLSGLQQQQAGAQQSALGRQQQAYGTTVGAMNGAGSLSEQASQNPTMFDKIMGGVAGAVGGAGGLLSKLEDGAVMPSKRIPAVVGEGGPEKVVSVEPYRSSGIRSYMDTGGIVPTVPTVPTVPVPASLDSPTPAAPTGIRGFINRINTALTPTGYADASAPQPQPQGPVTPGPVNTARTLGQIGGALAGKFLEDGAVMPQGRNGVFTKPTRVNLEPGEAAVPLTYRAKAKVRPSMASLPAARVR
jgi:hypothetical protein